jgi:hypothetical protein
MGTKKLLQFPATAKYSFQFYFGLMVDSAAAAGTP